MVVSYCFTELSRLALARKAARDVSGELSMLAYADVC
jgi:hypothetical protein